MKAVLSQCVRLLTSVCPCKPPFPPLAWAGGGGWGVGSSLRGNFSPESHISLASWPVTAKQPAPLLYFQITVAGVPAGFTAGNSASRLKTSPHTVPVRVTRRCLLKALEHGSRAPPLASSSCRGCRLLSPPPSMWPSPVATAPAAGTLLRWLPYNITGRILQEFTIRLRLMEMLPGE